MITYVPLFTRDERSGKLECVTKVDYVYVIRESVPATTPGSTP